MLEGRDVLVLVHHEVLVLATYLRRHVLPAAQHRHHEQQDVLEVDDLALSLDLLVGFIQPRHRVQVQPAGRGAAGLHSSLGVGLRTRHRHLGPLDLGSQVSHESAVAGKPQAPGRRHDQTGLRLLDAGPAPADHRGIEVVQLTQRRGVEGACLDQGHPQVRQPRAHLPGRPLGEGDGQDLAGLVGADSRTVGDAVGDGPGLSGAGSCQHAHRPFQVLSDLTLVRVQGVKKLLGAARSRRRETWSAGWLVHR